MIIRNVLLVFSLLACHEGGKHKNLQVLEDDHKAIDAGMKQFAKGLGVKCGHCHVKDKMDADDKDEKKAAREFFRAAVGESDQAKQKAALATLLPVLKLEQAKDEADIWKALSSWKKKK